MADRGGRLIPEGYDYNGRVLDWEIKSLNSSRRFEWGSRYTPAFINFARTDKNFLDWAASHKVTLTTLRSFNGIKDLRSRVGCGNLERKCTKDGTPVLPIVDEKICSKLARIYATLNPNKNRLTKLLSSPLPSPSPSPSRVSINHQSGGIVYAGPVRTRPSRSRSQSVDGSHRSTSYARRSPSTGSSIDEDDEMDEEDEEDEKDENSDRNYRAFSENSKASPSLSSLSSMSLRLKAALNTFHDAKEESRKADQAYDQQLQALLRMRENEDEEKDEEDIRYRTNNTRPTGRRVAFE